MSKVFDIIKKEEMRQIANVELIASENIVSKAVLLAAGTVLTNKYAEGFPAKRYYGGCQYVDIVEDLARERAKKLFGAEHANVQPHSGANANLAVFFALVNPGDTVMGLNLDTDVEVDGLLVASEDGVRLSLEIDAVVSLGLVKQPLVGFLVRHFLIS